MKGAAIQTVRFNTISNLNQSAISKVNSALMTTSGLFNKEAKRCRTVAQGHPWDYDLTLEKILLSEKYLSVVFAKSTVCAGSPDIEKEARVFSLPTGNLVPTKALFKKIFPTAKIITSISKNKELIDLDEEMIENMIGDSKKILRNYDSQCDYYLRNSSYRIWVDGKNLILFPEFLQPQSICQKEYVMQPED